MGELRVAIIGGGAAGLSAAIYLQGASVSGTGDTVQCTVYEARDRWGGNVQSAYTGMSRYTEPFGDLGVNDFNHDTYTHFVSMLENLAAHGFPVRYEPLLDTTLFFTPENQKPVYRYTYKQMEAATDGYLKIIKEDWNDFKTNLPEYMNDPVYRYLNVDEFCAARKYRPEFIRLNLKPRINGMYYTNGKDPGSMSIYGVMKYYYLQENIHKDSKHARKYFVDGASSWIQAACGYLEKAGADLRFNVQPNAARTQGGGWVIGGGGLVPESFDVVISALPADKLDDVFGGALPAPVSRIAGGFEYLSSTSYFHTDKSVLPADESLWRTYNITIEDPDSKTDRPYVISYVSLMHQGVDSASPPFVSVDPQGVSDDKVLEMFGPGDTRDKVAARSTLRHNTLYPPNIRGQEELPDYQGQSNVYYTGGWTTGAGLHEEVLGQSAFIAAKIRGVSADHLREVHDPDDASYVPRHLRTHGPDPDEVVYPVEEDHPLRKPS